MITVTVAPEILRAALLFTKTDALMGSTMRDEYRHIILDQTIVASDGHTMFVANPREVKIEGTPRPVLLHRGFVEHVAMSEDLVTFMIGKQAMDAEGNLYPLAEGVVVNWRKVYPRYTNGATSQYNLLYLHRAVRANVELGAKPGAPAGEIHVHHNGTSGPCVLELHDRRAHVIVQYLMGKSRDMYTPFNV